MGVGSLNSLVFDKSKRFAVQMVRLYNYLRDEKKEFVISKQMLRSGTSIGANLAEAEYGYSREDFTNKLYVALKECAEMLYWLELLYNTEYLNAKQYSDLRDDCEEIRKMLSSATKTLTDD